MRNVSRSIPPGILLVLSSGNPSAITCGESLTCREQTRDLQCRGLHLTGYFLSRFPHVALVECQILAAIPFAFAEIGKESKSRRTMGFPRTIHGISMPSAIGCAVYTGNRPGEMNSI